MATDADCASYERFGFGTEYRDETGLIYYGARYYSPALGRFISRDPSGVVGSGVNLYAFCGGDPVNHRELYGLCDNGDWGSVGSFFSSVGDAISGAISYIDDAIGGAWNYITSDQAAEPESNLDPSGASGYDPGCQVIGVDQNGNYVVAVTNQEAFDQRVSEYKQRNNGENPVLANYPDAKGIIDSILSGCEYTVTVCDMSYTVTKYKEYGNYVASSSQADINNGIIGTYYVISEAKSRTFSFGEDSNTVLSWMYSECPSYDPSSWNDGGSRGDGVTIQGNSNCYAYACNQKGPFVGGWNPRGMGRNFGFGVQPGYKSGNPVMYPSDITVNGIRDRAIADGLSPVPVTGSYPVNLVVAVGIDYHWYRQDADGSWSHKPGAIPVTNLDASGNRIADISTADWGIYTENGGILWVPPGFRF